MSIPMALWTCPHIWELSEVVTAVLTFTLSSSVVDTVVVTNEVWLEGLHRAILSIVCPSLQLMQTMIETMKRDTSWVGEWICVLGRLGDI